MISLAVLLAAATPSQSALPDQPLGAAGLDRPHQPLVLHGADLPTLSGAAPDRIVGFRFDGSWQQIPVQADERFHADFGLIYDRQQPTGFTTFAYADPDTFTGPDPDPSFDDDDELCLMLADSGQRALGPPPAGTLAGTGLEVRLVDPLDGGTAFVYLFESDGSLDPSAGLDYVQYSFVLLSGDYRSTYDLRKGPNPEDSSIVSPNFRTHFSDRWIRDATRVFRAGASGVDLLDRHKFLFAPGNCNRSEDTFSLGGGAFVCNIDGPVRVIRSYLGANSGPWTERQHIAYASMQEITTFQRVHAIGGSLHAYDYAPGAVGTTYHDNLNPAGVLVDGVPDTVATGTLRWQMITGDQGTVLSVLTHETDILDYAPGSYYEDDSTPPAVQCTGDAFEYAQSGTWVTQTIPNTDPALGNPKHLTLRRTVFYEAPHTTVETARQRNQHVRRSVSWSVAGY